MRRETVRKAERFVRWGAVKMVVEDSNPPTFFKFLVKSDGVEHEVYLTTHKGYPTWSCCAINRKNNKIYGCVMHTGDKSFPFCSHTLSCLIYLRKHRKELWAKVRARCNLLVVPP